MVETLFPSPFASPPLHEHWSAESSIRMSVLMNLLVMVDCYLSWLRSVGRSPFSVCSLPSILEPEKICVREVEEESGG